jgi:cytochrome oxidase Cu insertion factor (SCO1/SenC/PrrC family)
VSMTKAEIVVWGLVAAGLGGVVALAVFARSPSAPPRDEAPAAATPADDARSHDEEPERVELAGVAPAKTTELLPQPGNELGDYACVERSGKATRTSELRGKFLVVDFIFTNCGGPCPLMTEAMSKLQAAVAGADDVRLVSFSVDPDRDSPEALSNYADRYKADKERWLFLRAELPDLREIAYDRLGLVGSREQPVIHSPKFALLDRTGRVRGYYSPMTDPVFIATILKDLEKLRAEPVR